MAEEHRVWWKEDRIVVAGDNDLKRGVIHYFHNTPSAGHPGITNTYNLAKCDTWWPYMKQDVEQYVKGCAVCQANKVNTRPLKPGMAPITPEHSLPFQTVAMDFITKLPKSGKKEYVTFTGPSYLIAPSDSLSLGLSSFFLLISSPTPGTPCTAPDDLLIRSCDIPYHSTVFYHEYRYY
jgi:hypothetical protein